MGCYDTIKNYRQEKFTDRKTTDNILSFFFLIKQFPLSDVYLRKILCSCLCTKVCSSNCLKNKLPVGNRFMGNFCFVHHTFLYLDF